MGTPPKEIPRERMSGENKRTLPLSTPLHGMAEVNFHIFSGRKEAMMLKLIDNPSFLLKHKTKPEFPYITTEVIQFKRQLSYP